MFSTSIRSLLMVIFACVCLSAHAATITVNTGSDQDANDGNCTLREAIVAANTNAAFNGCAAGSGDDVIEFSGDQTIAWRGQQVEINENLTIQANAGQAVVIDGINAYTADRDGIFVVKQANNATNPIKLTVKRLTFRDYTVSTSGNYGGAIRVTESEGASPNELVVEQSGFHNIKVDVSSGIGGAILLGRYVIGTVTDSEFRNNDARTNGGAIFATNDSNLTVKRSLFANNTSKRGAGVRLHTGSITNSTFTGNTVTDYGSAIFIKSGAVTLANNTIVDNTAVNWGAVHGSSSPVVTMDANLMMNNFSSDDGFNINCSKLDTWIDGQNMVHANHNYADTNDGNSTLDCHLVGNNNLLSQTTPLANVLATLADNDCGSEITSKAGAQACVHTRMLVANSPAINVGSNVTNAPNDQRGNGFDRVMSGQADIGAVEYPAFYVIGGELFGLGAGKSVKLQLNGAEILTHNQNGSFTFSTQVAHNNSYSVTVHTPPAGQNCTVSNGSGTATANVTNITVNCVDVAPTTYSIGGSITGLGAGKTVVLQNNGSDDLTRTSNGGFTFATEVNENSNYAVTVKTQPVGQSCEVTNSTGIATADVSNVQVACTDLPKFTIGGTVYGLTSGTVVLQNNAGNDLSVSSGGSGAFTFSEAIFDGSAYAVTVKDQPGGGLSCAVSNGSGTVAGANVTNVTITCSSGPFSVGGNVSGLGAGKTVKLTLNGGNELTQNADGSFTFPPPLLPSGTAYTVAVSQQPSGQTCSVSNGSDTISGDVTNVIVVCEDNAVPTYTIGGSLSGLSGGSVTLTNGSDTLTLSNNTASFTISTGVESGTNYYVQITAQPTGQVCSITNAAGQVGSSNITDVTVVCESNPAQFYVRGYFAPVPYSNASITLLQTSTNEQITVSPGQDYVFPTPLANGADYQVVPVSFPSHYQTCNTGVGGTIDNSDAYVDVYCQVNILGVKTWKGHEIGPNRTVILEATITDPNNPSNTSTHQISMTAANNPDSNNPAAIYGVSVDFPVAVEQGFDYSISIASQPVGQVCVLTGEAASGSMPADDVTPTLKCAPPTYLVGGTVKGLNANNSVVLTKTANNGVATEDLVVSSSANVDVPFVFTERHPTSTQVSLAVKTQPTGQTCAVTSSDTTVMGNGDYNSFVVTCTNNTYTIGGTVSGVKPNYGAVIRLVNGPQKTLFNDGGWSFVGTKLNHGQSYTVELVTAPVGKTCLIENATGTATANIDNINVICTDIAYTIGGQLSGLNAGLSVVLKNNSDMLVVTANGGFTFNAAMTYGQTYNATIVTNPPGQTCKVGAGSGTVQGNVTTIKVSCEDNEYWIGGTVQGLDVGESVQLQNNGADNLSVPGTASGNSPFQFTTPLYYGNVYEAEIIAVPEGKTCTIENNSGTVSTSDVSDILVVCVPKTYVISGALSGLDVGKNVSVSNNGGTPIQLIENGNFSFPIRVVHGGSYAVAITTNPDGQTCSVANGSGSNVTANVTNVAITCVASTGNTFSIGGTVQGLASGKSVTLQNNAGNDLIRNINGSFTFSQQVPENGSYVVSVKTQPVGQTCTVSNASGSVTGAVTNVSVVCADNPAATYTIGGSVQGLTTGSVTLQNNGGDDLVVSSNTPFTFSQPVAENGAYNVTVKTQPVGQTCTVSNASGSATANVTNVTVVCVDNSVPRFSVGGNVSGLGAGLSVVLKNNGSDPTTVNLDGGFTFAIDVPQGGTYEVTVDTQPVGQTCTVTANGSGTVNAAVTNVQVQCQDNTTPPPAPGEIFKNGFE